MTVPIPQAHRVSQILPTASVTDPQTRAVLDSIVSVINERSGFVDAKSPHRFVTAAEIGGLTTKAVMQTFAGGVTGGVGTDATGTAGPGGAARVIDSLAQAIMNSLLFRKLSEGFSSIDVSALRAQLGNTVNAAVSSESKVRSLSDNALAQAINTIWAQIGGSSAVIQDGALAAAGTNSAQATAWKQVQAAVTDPNTGTIYQAAIKQTFDTYASSVDSTLNAIYTLRVQLNAGGITYTATAQAAGAGGAGSKGQNKISLQNQTGTPTVGMYAYGPGVPAGATVAAVGGTTVSLSNTLNADVSTSASAYSFSTQLPVVGGMGIAATQGAGSGQGPTIAVGFLANQFWIAAPTGSYDPASAFSVNDGFPFIVLTTPTVINGVTLSPGVYMKKVMIADASIDTAKIAFNIHSNNFDGSFNSDGSIATVGTTGWAVDKNGTAVFNNGTFRGTLGANIVQTDNIVGNALTDTTAPAPTASSSLTFNVVVASGAHGASAMVIHASTGESIYGSGQDITTDATRFTITCNGVSITCYGSGTLVIPQPADGTYPVTISCLSTGSAGAQRQGFGVGSQIRAAAMVYKR